MKKLIVFLLVLPFLLGQAVVYDDEVSVAWDPVESLGGDTISYEVFVAPLGDYGAAQVVGQTAAVEMDVSIPAEGKWVIGVRTIRTVNGEVLYSEINWSDQNGAMTPNPFIVGYFTDPAAPGNLRIQ